jgi:hypothetical protein
MPRSGLTKPTKPRSGHVSVAATRLQPGRQRRRPLHPVLIYQRRRRTSQAAMSRRRSLRCAVAPAAELGAGRTRRIAGGGAADATPRDNPSQMRPPPVELVAPLVFTGRERGGREEEAASQGSAPVALAGTTRDA